MRANFLLIFFFLSMFLQAQVTSLQESDDQQDKKMTDDPDSESILKTDSLFYTPEAWDTNLDNLLNSWHVKHYTNQISHEGYNETVLPANDSVYMERLASLPKLIELPYNEVVRSCIDYYVERRRSLVEYMLGMESFYFPMIEEALDKYDLPLELKYLTIVESALNPIALSRAGASGLWQFMLPTGKLYGLEINSLIDERRDPIKSTDAACRFFSDLYKIYGDWNLVLAAYNCGAGNVNKAIKRANGKKDYWEIYQYLPRETRNYIPFFIAANYVMNYYPYHQLYPVQVSLPASTDTVMVTQPIHFDQIAQKLRMEKEEIRAMNPQYKRDIIPGAISKAQILKLPSIYAYAFVEMEDSIASHRFNDLFPNRNSVATGNISPKGEKIIHKVAKGETLVTIGNKYGLTALNIRKWNGLKSNKVAVDKNLILYVNNGGIAINNSAKNKAATPKPAIASKSNATTSSAVPVWKKAAATANTEQYEVKAGDSLYSIARNYPGYSHTDLMNLNNMKSGVALKVGQLIKVPKI